MINLYVKLNVHEFQLRKISYSAKSGGQTDTPDKDNRHPPKVWLRLKKCAIQQHAKKICTWKIRLSKSKSLFSQAKKHFSSHINL